VRAQDLAGHIRDAGFTEVELVEPDHARDQTREARGAASILAAHAAVGRQSALAAR
jgi:hypothetical protein